MLHSDSENNKTNWCSNLKDLLYSLGMGEAWYFQTVGNEQQFLILFKQRLSDTALQDWHANLSDTNRGKLYLSFHSSLSPATYLEKVKNEKHRVESGRWTRPPIEFHQRKCETCDTLDDEYHFVMECKIHSELRKDSVPGYFTRNSSMYKFTKLMSIENVSELKKMAVFAHKAFSERSALL